MSHQPGFLPHLRLPFAMRQRAGALDCPGWAGANARPPNFSHSKPANLLGAATSRRRAPPSQPKTFWDETSQPLSSPSTTSALETSRLQNSHAPQRPSQFRTSPALPQPVFKTLKGFQTVAGGKAARPPPPVPRPQNVQPPPLAEGVGGGGIPESPPAVSPNPSRCSAIPRRRNKPHRGSLPRSERTLCGPRPSPAPPISASVCVLCGPVLPAAKPEG